MDNQEVYDKVKAHLLSQNRKSLELGGGCAYRGMDGAMCAVGVLIPDDMYSRSMEGSECGVGEVRDVLANLGINGAFARGLQQIHDGVYLSNWNNELKRFAVIHGLKP